MAFRTILLYLDELARADALLTLAGSLARRHSAHLIGVYIKPPVQVYVSSDVAVPMVMSDDHEALHNSRAQELEARFTAATANDTFASEWRYVASDAAAVPETLTELARTVDLVIVGRKNPAEYSAAQRDLPEQLLMSVNRPVLLLPHSGEFPAAGANVFVAWDGGAAATRAVFDSLPALQLAESVTVHRINPARHDRHRIAGTASDLVKTLSRHGIDVELAESDAKSGEVGADLLFYAREKSADLLVMGAYGHSRFREYIFGGVSKYVLDNLTLPAILSH